MHNFEFGIVWSIHLDQMETPAYNSVYVHTIASSAHLGSSGVTRSSAPSHNLTVPQWPSVLRGTDLSKSRWTEDYCSNTLQGNPSAHNERGGLRGGSVTRGATIPLCVEKVRVAIVLTMSNSDAKLFYVGV
ncbi:hypothetical protein NPIL_601741 [Nephila pilipes]|uniref:Uncharacterized protein n=1 Tax=Nephila pilipes TaxID=299642 RepID=A0A8X6UKW3_NEPPI|nr:hypothetical protein NPIL_601741 [Nephila pilipes]